MKSNLDKHFKPSEELEKNGVWFDLDDNTGFLVRPFKATNPKVKSAIAIHFKPYARQIEMGTLPEEKVQEVNMKVFIASSLVDWRGIEIDGVKTDYNPEVALKLFKSMPDLFTTLFDYASSFKNFKEEVGNS